MFVSEWVLDDVDPDVWWIQTVADSACSLSDIVVDVVDVVDVVEEEWEEEDVDEKNWAWNNVEQ